jgi:hypothetical protein
MPTWTDEEPRRQQDRERQPGGAPKDEARNFETDVSDGDHNYDAPFDSDLEPIEDDDINTHGSER